MDENAELHIPSCKVAARDARAQEGIDEWDKMIPPQAGFKEQCYYHSFEGNKGIAMLYNRKIDKGLSICFDAEQLDSLTEWKMMGVRDYVLGLEPSNSKLEGRSAMKANGELKYLEPEEEQSFTIEVNFYDDYISWVNDKNI